MREMEKSIAEFQDAMKALMKNNRDSMKDFQEFMGHVLEPGALDTKTKELIALGTAITARCKYCIALHVKTALEAGATQKEIMEAAMVSILMGGGPALTHVAEVKKALDEFK
jgi:AhpD family alkylhydroperoxidase